MDPFIAITFVLTLFGLVYLGLRAHQARNLHTERMAAIEKGVDAKLPILVNATPAFGHRIYLLRGLVWIAVGVTLFAALAVTGPFLADATGPAERLESKLLRASNLKSLGVSDAQIAAMEGEIGRQASQRPNPALLGTLGLVPIGVGVAYLIFYALEERRLRALPPS